MNKSQLQIDIQKFRDRSNYADWGFNEFIERKNPALAALETDTDRYAGLTDDEIATHIGNDAVHGIDWTTTIEFTSVDHNTVSWSEGTISWADGEVTPTIASSDTGNMASKTFVYYDPQGDKAALATTTNYATAIKGERFILATLSPDADTDKKAAVNTIGVPNNYPESLTGHQIDDGTVDIGKLTTGHGPNLIPEKYSNFEYFNDGDSIGSISTSTAAACYIALQHTDLDAGSPFPPTHQKIARAIDGTLWVVYMRTNDRYVYAAFSADGGATWTHEQVYDPAAAYTMKTPSIAIDSGGTPHVAWAHTNGAWVQYSKRTAVDTWATPTTITSALGTACCSIAVDGNDDIHIAYSYSTAAGSGSVQCRYRKYTSGAWQAEETIYSGSSGRDMGDVDIDIDSNNIPHVVWSQRGQDATYWRQSIIKYANRIGGSWTVETVQDFDNGEAVGWDGFYYAGIIIDTNDKPHVIYKNLTNYTGGGDIRRLFYTWRDTASGDWATNKETVYSGGTAVGGLALGMSQANVVWVLYEQSNDIYSTYRESASGDWTTNLTNYTNGSYNDPNNPAIIGACYPKSGSTSVNKFASGYSLALIENPATGSNMIVFCDGNSVFSTAEAQTTVIFEGKKTMRLNLSTGEVWNAGDNNTDYNSPVESETEYVYSAFVRSVTGTVSLSLKTKEDDTTETTVATQNITTSWVRISGTMTTAAGVTTLLARMSGDGDIYADCLMFEKASTTAGSPEATPWKPSSVVDRLIQDLFNVSVSTADKDLLAYNLSEAEWQNKTFAELGLLASGVADMNDLANTDLADPNDDRIVFWDDSDGQYEWLITGNGLTIAVNTITVVDSEIDHDSLTNYTSAQHFTMLDEDNFASNSATHAATQQSIKAYANACAIKWALMFS